MEASLGDPRRSREGLQIDRGKVRPASQRVCEISVRLLIEVVDHARTLGPSASGSTIVEPLATLYSTVMRPLLLLSTHVFAALAVAGCEPDPSPATCNDWLRCYDRCGIWPEGAALSVGACDRTCRDETGFAVGEVPASEDCGPASTEFSGATRVSGSECRAAVALDLAASDTSNRDTHLETAALALRQALAARAACSAESD